MRTLRSLLASVMWDGIRRPIDASIIDDPKGMYKELKFVYFVTRPLYFVWLVDVAQKSKDQWFSLNIPMVDPLMVKISIPEYTHEHSSLSLFIFLEQFLPPRIFHLSRRQPQSNNQMRFYHLDYKTRLFCFLNLLQIVWPQHILIELGNYLHAKN